MSRIVRGEDNPAVPVLSEVMNAVDAIPDAIERWAIVQVISAWVEWFGSWIESGGRPSRHCASKKGEPS